MKGYAMLGIGKTGWIEKERPLCGPLDAIVRPIAVSPCTSDVHTVWEGAIGDRHNMILGHEAVGEVVEVGALVRDFKCGDRVIIPAITPDWGAEIEFEWKGVLYGVIRYGTDHKITIYQCGHPETEKVCETEEEALEYMVGEDRLRDVITQVRVVERTI